MVEKFKDKIIETMDTAFSGHDASRALAQSSLDKEQVRADYEDLTEEQKKVLDQWFTFFSKRYSIVGKVRG